VELAGQPRHTGHAVGHKVRPRVLAVPGTGPWRASAGPAGGRRCSAGVGATPARPPRLAAPPQSAHILADRT
jgi:hypothetical protein